MAVIRGREVDLGFETPEPKLDLIEHKSVMPEIEINFYWVPRMRLRLEAFLLEEVFIVYGDGANHE